MAEELKERKAFEAHMRVGGHSNHDKHPDGSYVSSAMELWWQGWKARAQLPSQGGEAVATHLGWDFLDDGSRVATYFIRAPGEVAPKLYTHPADQVADDLTMVKVSRELLQDLRDLAFDQVEHHRAAMGAYKQTRQSAMDSALAQAYALLEVKP